MANWCFVLFLIQISKAELSPEALSAYRSATGYQGNTLCRIRMSAFKPNFEVGSSSQIKLSFGSKTPKPGSFKLLVFFIRVHFSQWFKPEREVFHPLHKPQQISSIFRLCIVILQMKY